MASDDPDTAADLDLSGYSVMLPGHPGPTEEAVRPERPGERSTSSESMRLPEVRPLFHVDSGE